MKTLENVLVAVDFSTGSGAALKQAARIAQLHDATLHVLHVVDSMAVAMLARSLIESDETRAKLAAEGASEALARWIKQSGAEVKGKVMVVVGTPLSEILEHVRNLKVDMLVAGITGAGESPAGAGGISSKLARKAMIPLMLVRSDHAGAFRKIVAGIDFSENSREVAEQAHCLAAHDGARVDFLHVWQEPWVAIPYFAVPSADAAVPVVAITPEQLKSYILGLKQELHDFVKPSTEGINASEILLEAGSYGQGIADHALESKADLIIVGGKGRTNLRYVLLGSTAERLLTRLPCSLLVVKREH